MDRERFDELARLLATKGSRRSALGALLSVAFLGHDPDDADAKPGKSKGKAKAKRKGHDKGRGKGHDKGKGQGHSETEERVAVQPEEFRAAPESDDDPEVQAEAQGGGRGKKAKGRGKSKGRNKEQSGSRTSQTQTQALTTRCCGTKSCSFPTAGSNRYECNFAGQNLSGRNMAGVNFGKIDGRKTNFSNANVRGANFGAACLQEANFRGADVSSTNLGKACVFFADFTGARNLNVSVTFSTALLCGTILADGTVSNRDCGRATTCCAACDAQRPCDGDQVCCNGRCRDGECCAAADCENRVCQSRACVGNECQYTPVTGGTCPLAGGGTGTCCGGVCCTANQICDTRPNPDVCCTPETQNQTCGVGTPNPKCGTVTNNCGKPVNCGSCPVLTCQNGSCTGPNNTCVYTPVEGTSGPNCQNSICCKNQAGEPICCPQDTTTCDDNGQCCQPRTCQPNQCGTISNGCGGTITCPDCTGGQVCVEGTCQNCTNTEQCNDGEICCDGTCQIGNCCPTAGDDEGIAETCGANQNCCATGCIGNNNLNNCGECGNRCPNDICRVRTCIGGECGFTLVPNGDQGFDCDATGEFCCGGSCCTTGQVCNTGPNPDVCCTPDTREETCRPFEGPQRCGISVVNNCGQLVNCGDCDVRTCETANCNGAPDGTCQYTDVFGTTGPNCTTVCCRNTEGDPVCCEEGITICSSEGLCGCGGDNDCGESEICCSGTCIANTLCCAGNPSTCPDPGTCKVRACNGAGQCAPANAAQSSNCTVGADLGVCCGGVCIVDDPNNCTACGTACPAAVCEIATCNDRVCGITPVNDAQAEGCNADEFICCAGDCKDTNTDEDNCGGCAPPNGDGDICVEPGELCVSGVCVCNAESCPNGCCSNGPGNPGICRTSSDTSCGINGVLCIDCPDGQACNASGICVCTAQSCSGGCCSNGPGNVGTCQTSGNDTCGINGVLCVDCPSGTPFCNASGVCVACLTPANCPTPPTCSVATCTAGVCGTAPLQDVQGPGCTAAGKICCNGFCVDDQAGQCPICCQTPGICREAFGPNAECVGSGACRVGGIDTCASTGKCCRP